MKPNECSWREYFHSAIGRFRLFVRSFVCSSSSPFPIRLHPNSLSLCEYNPFTICTISCNKENRPTPRERQSATNTPFNEIGYIILLMWAPGLANVAHIYDCNDMANTMRTRRTWNENESVGGTQKTQSMLSMRTVSIETCNNTNTDTRTREMEKTGNKCKRSAASIGKPERMERQREMKNEKTHKFYCPIGDNIIMWMVMVCITSDGIRQINEKERETGLRERRKREKRKSRETVYWHSTMTTMSDWIDAKGPWQWL